MKCINCGQEIGKTDCCFSTVQGQICMSCEFKEIPVYELHCNNSNNKLISDERESLQTEIDEDESDNEYKIVESKMRVLEYYNLTDFEGF